jgi:hypothetical protein
LGLAVIGRDATLHHGATDSKLVVFVASAWIDCSEGLRTAGVENAEDLGEMWVLVLLVRSFPVWGPVLFREGAERVRATGVYLEGGKSYLEPS